MVVVQVLQKWKSYLLTMHLTMPLTFNVEEDHLVHLHITKEVEQLNRFPNLLNKKCNRYNQYNLLYHLLCIFNTQEIQPS